MAEANAHYYATRDPLGAAGDFTTAPEISQMFGELVGPGWPTSGPAPAGPTARAMSSSAPAAARSPPTRFGRCAPAGLEPAGPFRRDQPRPSRAPRPSGCPSAHWHDDLATLPEDGPLLVVANEFFDALPVRQLVATGKRLARADGRLSRTDAFARSPARRCRPPPSRRACATRRRGRCSKPRPAVAGVVRAACRRLIAAGRRGADRRLRP